MLSKNVLVEICEILKNEGRDDLIAILIDNNDEDYVPVKDRRIEFYSDDEGSATDESLEVEVDDEGFYSISG